MNKFDKVFGGLILGFIIPVISMCIFWWGSFLLGLDIQFWVIAGIVIGVVLDIMLLRKILSRFYYLSTFTLLILYLVYSIGIFGFFMGVPVFNIITGIISGVYVGRKTKITGQSIDIFKDEIRKAAKFSSVILLGICFCSAFIAVTDPYTGANLQGMLNLGFEVTNTIICLVIIFGGAGLLLLQYLLLLKAGRIAYEKINW